MNSWLKTATEERDSIEEYLEKKERRHKLLQELIPGYQPGSYLTKPEEKEKSFAEKYFEEAERWSNILQELSRGGHPLSFSVEDISLIERRLEEHGISLPPEQKEILLSIVYLIRLISEQGLLGKSIPEIIDKVINDLDEEIKVLNEESLKVDEKTKDLDEKIKGLDAEIEKLNSEVKNFDEEIQSSLKEQLAQLILQRKLLTARYNQLIKQRDHLSDKLNRATQLKEEYEAIRRNPSLIRTITELIKYDMLNEAFNAITNKDFGTARDIVKTYNLYYDSLDENGKGLISSAFKRADLLSQAAIIAIFKPSLLTIPGYPRSRNLLELAESYAKDLIKTNIPGSAEVYSMLIELLPKETVTKIVKEHVAPVVPKKAELSPTPSKSADSPEDLQKAVQVAITKHILRNEWEQVKALYFSLQGGDIDWNAVFNFAIMNILRYIREAEHIRVVIDKLRSIKPDFELEDNVLLLISHYFMSLGKYGTFLDPKWLSILKDVLTNDQKVTILKEYAKKGRADLIVEFLKKISETDIPDSEKTNIIDNLLASSKSITDILSVVSRFGELSNNQKIEIFKRLVSIDHRAAKQFAVDQGLDLTKVPKPILDDYIFEAAISGDFDEALSYGKTVSDLFNWLLNNPPNKFGFKLYKQAYDLASEKGLQIPLNLKLEMLEYFHKRGDTERAQRIGREIVLSRSEVGLIPHELFQYIKQAPPKKEQQPNA